MRAAIYVRISRDTAGEGLGVARQEADCRELVAARGWEVGRVFVDNDVSAYSGRVRPSYRAMLDAVAGGEFGAVVAWHPDRLHRRPVDLEEFIDVVEASGVVVATVRAGEVDLASASGRMVARVVGAMARHESEQKSERLRRKHRELAAAGKLSGGGTRPFGFERDRVSVRQSEARLVAEAAERVAAGESLRSVARWLDGRCEPVQGGEWSTHVLRRMLLSPRVAGLRSHRGEVVGDAVWPALVDRVTWERCRRVLTDPARRVNGAPRRYLLTGLAVCGLCGVRLVARPKDGRPSVVCASGPGFGGCGQIRCMADPLDEWVSAAVLDAVETAGVASWSQRRPEVASVLAEVDALEARLVELAEMWADGGLDRRSWLVARERIEARLVVLRAELGSPVVPAGVRAAWPTMGVEHRRVVIGAVVESVTVGPAVRGRNFFDPGRVSIAWR